MWEAGHRQSRIAKHPRTRLQMPIAFVIRRLRKNSRLSQEAFADHIGMNRAQYSIVERGTRDIRLSTLQRVADGLEMPLWVILREAEESSLTTPGHPANRHPSPDRGSP